MATHELGDRRPDAVVRARAELRHGTVPEVHADDGGVAEQGFLCARQSIEAGGDHRLHGGRHEGLAGHVGEQARALLCEEGVAGAAGGDERDLLR
ncbi:MAG: hypothetical protein WCJ18_11565 [Planctomycetota bacterium]